ncbi:MAG TPA: Ig-like domain-containing protein [Planctomycetota bacterium]|nr:Ig-like domain-containing protein [Planctomycetota bacterium]
MCAPGRLAPTAAAGLLLLAGHLAAQRVATAGRVCDAGADPLVAATVTFVGAETPFGDRFAPADHVVTSTDEHGRFRAGLLAGHDYTAWVTSAARGNGERFVSEFVDGVRPGSGLELRAVQVRSPSRLRVSGLDAWADVGPLRGEIGVAAAHVHFEPFELGDEPAALPTLPIGAQWLLLVRDREGRLLHAARLPAQRGDFRFVMPAPRAIPVHVTDPDGMPIAGAVLRFDAAAGAWTGDPPGLQKTRPFVVWRSAGTTGADGRATVTVPSRMDPFQASRDAPMLLASKLDHAAAWSSWAPTFVRGAAAGGHDERVLCFTLRPRPAWRGRILEAENQPLAGARIELAATYVTGQANSPRRRTAFETNTAGDGTFVFDGLPADLEQASVLIDVAAAPETAGSGAARRQRLVRTPALLEPELDRPLELDLSRLPMLTIEVRDRTGGPARHADVVLLPGGRRRLDDATHTFQLDALGAARVRVQRGAWSVFVTDGSGCAVALVEVGQAQPLPLALADLAVLKGRVRLLGEAHMDDVRFLLNSIINTTRAADPVTAALRAVGTEVNQWLLSRARVGADGAFELRLLDVPGTRYAGLAIAGALQAKLDYMALSDGIELDLKPR